MVGKEVDRAKDKKELGSSSWPWYREAARSQWRQMCRADGSTTTVKEENMEQGGLGLDVVVYLYNPSYAGD